MASQIFVMPQSKDLAGIKKPYDSQTEECDGIADICHAAGSKDLAGIIADEDQQAEEPSK